MEQRWAKQYNCNLIGIKEEDERHGAADFGEEIETGLSRIPRSELIQS